MVKVEELAKKRREIINKLEQGGTGEAFRHIIKLCIFNSPQNNSHWKTEVYSNLHAISKTKENNRYLDSLTIFNTIWDMYGDRIDDLTDMVLEDELNEKLKSEEELSQINIKEICRKYIKWLSKRLSANGEVRNHDVRNKLTELGL